MLILSGALAGAVLVGSLTALALRQAPADGGLDEQLDGIVQPTTAEAPRTTTVDDKPAVPKEQPESCWNTYGGGPERLSDASATGWGRPRKRVWGRRMGSLMEFPPSTCDGVLYVNTAEGFTFALRSHDGKVLWRRRTGTVFDSTPAIAGRRLVIGGIDGNITGLDRATGRTLWRLKAGGPVESSPVVVGGTAYAASLDRRVYALNVRSGRVQWAYRTGGDIKGSPAVSQDGVVYAANYAGEVVALRAGSGKLVWRQAFRLDPIRTERIYSSTPISGRGLFFGTVGGYVYRLDRLNGRVQWRQRIGAYVYSTPAVADGRVFVGAFDGYVHTFDARSGRRLWRASMGGPISGSPVVIGRLVYASTTRGRTRAFDVRTGAPRWQVPRGKYVPGIATDRRIYLSLNGYLAAYQARRTG